MPTVPLDGTPLTLDRAITVASGGARVRLSTASKKKMNASRAVVDKVIRAGKPVYGINTGFGKLSNVSVARADLAELQTNLLRSHATGVGEPLGEAEVRLAMLLRTQTLAAGRSGVRPLLAETLIRMLNAGIHPIIPSQGSVGASGDLAPLAHMALVLIGEGEAFYEGKHMKGAAALKRARIRPVELQPKEGLALINGTQISTAIAALCIDAARRIQKVADVAGAMSLEAQKGTAVAFDRKIHAARPHAGQRNCAANLRKLLAASAIMRSHKDCGKVQDAYSFRCMPQVHGPSRDMIATLVPAIETEMNSVTDNPLVFAETGQGLSGGNVHGQSVAMAMDVLAIALSEFASISERRVEQLVNPDLSGLPPFLIEHTGLNSGMMISQVVAASLVSENKVLAHPAGVDSIPTSANKEDHVSMSTWAARKCQQVVQNVEHVLAIELLAGAQGIDFHRPVKPGRGVAAAHRAVRKRIPHLTKDRVMHKDITILRDAIRSGELVRAVEAACGTLK